MIEVSVKFYIFIKVLSLTFIFLENAKEVLRFYGYITKSCEEFVSAENIVGINKILAELPLLPFPAPYLAVFGAKLQLHAKYNMDEFQNMMLKINQICVELKDTKKDSLLAAFCKLLKTFPMINCFFCRFSNI